MNKIKFTATQKKEKLTNAQLEQIDFSESKKIVESCDIIISVVKDRTPGPHTVQMTYNGNGFIRSLFKK